MLLLTYFLLVIQGCVSLSCHSRSYHNDVSQKLEQLAKYKGYNITDGHIAISFNATYTASNPASAYGVYIFPEIISPQYRYEWKMSSSDAIIFAGCTMPKGKYFSFQHYVNQRIVNHQRTQLFADLGAAVNHLLINTSTSTDVPFDSLSTVILTGDQQTAMDIQSVLDPNSLNIISIPNEYVYFNPGSNDTVDTFSILYRMALWDNVTEYMQYVNNINGQTVWRLSLSQSTNSSEPRIPYKPYVLDTNCTYNEVNTYNATLNEYSVDLIKYIESTYSFKYVETVPFMDSQYYGFDCITYDIDCIGETRDATYWAVPAQNASGSLPYTNKSFYLVLGINHENTKQSVYIDITMYDYQVLEGMQVKGELTGAQLNGTALILPVDTDVKKEYLSNMWLSQLSRPSNCIYNDSGGALLIPGFCYNETQFNQPTFSLITRNYLNPETKTHPNRDQIVAPILLHFSV